MPAGFSRKDTDIIKGVGLLMIMLHNYFHIIPPISGQNEFSFHPDAIYAFLEFVKRNPADICRQLFSYLGHYGVSFFIFVSAYGLYTSYKNKPIQYFSFLKKRVKKLYPTLLVVVVLLFIFISLYEGSINFAKTKSLLLKLTLLSNFVAGEALAVDGPLWFFSVIVQLYALFPLLKIMVKKYGRNSLLLVAVACIAINISINAWLVTYDLSVYFLFIGQLPVFCLGMYWAVKPMRVPLYILIIAILILILSNFNNVAWHFSFLSCTFIMLYVFQQIKGRLGARSTLAKFLAYTGSISLSLFAIHGMIRFPFERMAEYYHRPLITSAIAILFLVTAFAASWCMRFLTGWLFSQKEKV